MEIAQEEEQQGKAVLACSYCSTLKEWLENGKGDKRKLLLVLRAHEEALHDSLSHEFLEKIYEIVGEDNDTTNNAKSVIEDSSHDPGNHHDVKKQNKETETRRPPDPVFTVVAKS